MQYFESLKKALEDEKKVDEQQYLATTQSASTSDKRGMGMAWYPLAIRGSEMTKGDYITVEFERTTHHDLSHQFRFGTPVAFFSNYDAQKDRINGTVTHQSGNRIKVNFRTEELPDWAHDGKLGLEVLFDNNSYEEMFAAIKQADLQAENNELIEVLTGLKTVETIEILETSIYSDLNASQNKAVEKIISAKLLAIVHGPPGTGKTTTLVMAIEQLAKNSSVLVVAPSNTAVDLLTEKLGTIGLNVLRVGNSSRVSELLQAQTLDHKVQAHPTYKEIKKLKKQASEYKNMAHKYKRNFGKAEREQRKALFDEAHKIMRDVENSENYIIEDILNKTQIVTATLVGANHYTVRNLNYDVVVIDEAGQALEPACWIPILKAKKVILAGDHLQLPPTIKSNEQHSSLSTTLLEKLTESQKESMVLLDTQYRMHHKIMAHSSKVFYKSQLKAAPSVENHLVHSTIEPILFIDTAGKSFDEKLEGTSSTNPGEALFLLKRLEDFYNNISSLKVLEIPTAGVISPYKQQIKILAELVEASELLNKYKEYITVNTIDSFQGQERDAIFISMVRSNNEQQIGFLADIRRMNVAMTRAKKALVIVGDSATIGNHSFYDGFINYCQNQNAYKSAWEYAE